MRGMLAVLVVALTVTGCGGSTGAGTVTVTKGADGVIQSTTNVNDDVDLPPLTPADIQIGVIVTEKKCFGTAGCNYKYALEPKYVATGPRSMDPVTIVYTVTGGDQDQIGNMTRDSKGTFHSDRETPTRGVDGAQFVATVTTVIPG